MADDRVKEAIDAAEAWFNAYQAGMPPAESAVTMIVKLRTARGCLDEPVPELSECVRCGCEIAEGEARLRWKVITEGQRRVGFLGPLWAPGGYDDIHASTDLCLVALRKKEVEQS